MAATTPPKVVFEHEGVFIHSSADESEDQDLISGFLRIVEKDGETLVEYKPLEDADPSNMLCACKDNLILFKFNYGKDSSSVVEWTQSSEDNPHRPLDHQLSYETEWDMINAVSFRRKVHSHGDGGSNHANDRNKWAFFFNVCDLRSITVKCEGWSYITFRLKDGTALPAIHFHQGGSAAFLDSLRKSVQINESPDDESVLIVSTYSKAFSQSFENLLDDSNYGFVQYYSLSNQKFKKDPYTTTLGGFSKVTNYLFDAFRAPELECQQRPAEEVADLLGELIPGLEINQQEEPGFEVITRLDLGPRPEVQRRGPVTMEEWAKYQDSEGRITNVPHLKDVIFKGGLCHAVRKEAWKFLLGYFPWNSTHEERKLLQKRKTDEYFRMKLQWKSVSEEQERRNSRLRDYRSLIGYVQGMSDLLSPILFVMENEVDAFWCFVSFMDEMHENFEEQMQGMKTQLIQLSTLLRLLDLAFWNYLEAQDSGYLYFCFRWLLIRFKRELHFQDVLRLWEVMWTRLPCQNFHLLVCCAILDSEKQKIMDRKYGFNEILKHINELSMKLDIEEILIKSEAICMQIKNCKLRRTSFNRIDERPDKEEPKSTHDLGKLAVIFSLKNEVGCLVKALRLFQEKHVNLAHIESRRSKRLSNEVEIYAECNCTKKEFNELVQHLKDHVNIVSYNTPQHVWSAETDCLDCVCVLGGLPDGEGIPWFPQKISELDQCSHRVLIGQPIPRIEYTEEEVKTWGVIFRELTKLYPTHACREYLKNLPLLTKHCGYREDNIPQLEDVSRFLRDRSGFTVRPVAGYLSPRDFLAGLAYRVFNCTQYIRHSTDPLYTPEPDTCHELLGHVPLLADPKFAQFSQEIGLASLGASDEDVQKLATCYFFTIEFGLCKQEGQLRAYGAGLLSSIGELRHALSDKAKVKMFDPKTTCYQECLITTFQDVYFVSESFEEAKEKMREFAKTIKRPFSVYYNPYTQSIDLLKDTRSIENVVQDLRSDLTTVCDALGKMNTYLGI
ncbi:TBC1 domain family member 15 [Labeo rohita]|uniref:Tryptophan 5-hydroxylase 2 n=2 Tax=Labeonini TaxID=2743697 RepID=A0A498MB17_LABRO|nr:TBC1 domain family member 15 [Labeo rohita]